MNRSQKIIRAGVIGVVANLLLAMIATTAMAQAQLEKVKIPADTRLYLQILENSNKEMRARSTDSTVAQPEAHRGQRRSACWQPRRCLCRTGRYLRFYIDSHTKQINYVKAGKRTVNVAF